jgi:hypothetical protein
MHTSESDTEFNAAIEFAKKEGYAVESAGGSYYIEWPFNDRDRALLALMRIELTNHRGIRIPFPRRIT